MNSLLRSGRWYYQRGKKPRRLKNEPKRWNNHSCERTPPCCVSQSRSPTDLARAEMIFRYRNAALDSQEGSRLAAHASPAKVAKDG